MKLITLFFVLISAISIGAKEQYITVHVATWNVNEKKPPGDLAKLLGQLPENEDERPDIVIVGLQEVTMSLKSAIKNYFLSDKWSKSIEDTLSNKKYVRIKTASLLGVIMNIYVKLQHAWSMDDVEIDRVMTGLGGLYANKGGVIIKFKLYNQSFCVVNAHFHAHDEELDERIDDYETINTERAEFCNYPSDYVFWLGDLNFRISEDPALTSERIKSIIIKGKESELLANDQLLLTRKTGKIFNDFKEAPITFKPTYKMVPNTGTYNLKRRPAWTDRVLYKSENDKEITPILYKSIESYTISDHYPVQAQFKIVVDTDKKSFKLRR
uniref:Venom IPPase 1 n=1 Tax=Platymeris rhadamanthus TaxID=1134088 RepID=A0A6B9KZ51_PLARH|nr:venom IPPase 1 [Platymeris rhadamanthus]